MYQTKYLQKVREQQAPKLLSFLQVIIMPSEPFRIKYNFYNRREPKNFSRRFIMIIAIVVLSVLLGLSTTAAIVNGIMLKRTYEDKEYFSKKIANALKESRTITQEDL